MAKKSTKGAIELLEEAVHLLRLAPFQSIALYYVGALPFILGFLYFWADMSRSAFAASRCAQAAMGVALLFFWMKTWQAIFASDLRGRLAGKMPEPLTFFRFVRTAMRQMVLQPSGFFLMPIALVITLPFVWTFTFYQNISALDDGQGGEINPLMKRSSRQAGLWMGQNHVVLSILFLFALFVWLNVMTALVFIPFLIKTFLGIESVFTRSGTHAIANTTFFAATCGITYLCVDPLVKAVYALRCFYGEALTTGEDLKTELKAGLALSKTAVVSALLFFCALAPFPVSAAENSSPATTVEQQAPSSAELDQSIEEVLSRREFTWRLPREKTETVPEKENWLTSFFKAMEETLAEWFRTVRDWARAVLEWLEKYARKKQPDHDSKSGSGQGWMTTLQVLIFVLLILVASAVAILFFRMWKSRQREEVVVAQAIPAVPDLADENVAANQLPEDGWLKLARELMEKGELRLALRAFYLASLAHLAAREFVSITKFKSNREYEQELRRRTRALPDLQTAFAENVSTFDRVWYGMHEVTGDIVQNFQSNLEKIRAC